MGLSSLYLGALWFLTATSKVQEDEKQLRGKLTEINEFLKTARTTPAFRAAIDDLMEVAKEASLIDAYDLATKALDQADRVQNNLKDPALSATVQALLVEMNSCQQEYVKVKGFIRTLEDTPDDPQANLAVGRFLCIHKGTWDRGMALLKMSKDGTLKLLAEAEEVGTGSTEEFLALGDRWAAYAEKNPKFSARSQHWYQRAWPGLKGIMKEKVKGKLKSVGMNPKGRILEGVPVAWGVVLPPGQTPGGLALDEVYVHTGRTSFRISPARAGMLVTHPIKIMENREFDVSFWIMTEGTTRSGLAAIKFYSDEKELEGLTLNLPVDQPWWTRVEATVTTPPGTTQFRFHVGQTSIQEGMLIWLDDISVKSKNTANVMVNGGFEGRK